MTITHIICPATQTIHSISSCHTCAKAGGVRNGTPCNIPYPIIASLAVQRRVGVGVSVTNFAGCWRKAWAERHIDYAADPRSRWAAEHGTIVHDAMEHLCDDLPPEIYRKEQRLWKETPHGVFSGQFDGVWVQRGELIDYKTKSKRYEEPPPEYILQLNIYRWMMMTGCYTDPKDPAGSVIEPIEIRRMSLYFLTHTECDNRIDVPIWEFDRIERYVHIAMEAFATNTFETIPRQYDQPEKSYFCQHFCPFTQLCTSGQIMPKP